LNVFLILGVIFVTAFIGLIYLLRKNVYDSEINVAVDASEYPRGATVNISGLVQTTSGTPEPSVTVNYSIQNPDGGVYGPFVTTTGGDGSFGMPWTVPATAPIGDYTLTATAKGVSDITTFILSKYT